MQKEQSVKEIMQTFFLPHIPTLDVAVEAALELFSEKKLPKFDPKKFKRPLVIGSIGAEATGKILFANTDAVFANESNYLEKLKTARGVDMAVVISASGAKHAIPIVKTLKKARKKVLLFTCNENTELKKVLSKKQIHVFPKNREPYTYNTSTYLGMILSTTKENPKKIRDFIKTKTKPLIPLNFGAYSAFYITVPARFDLLRPLFAAKFHELFGRKLAKDIFTDEQSRHATTVVPSQEMFIEFGDVDFHPGQPCHKFPLPSWASYGTMMAIGYYVIGHIQRQQPQYFKEYLEAYCKQAFELFGEEIKPIVE
jgi:hypothetical protein